LDMPRSLQPLAERLLEAEQIRWRRLEGRKRLAAGATVLPGSELELGFCVDQSPLRWLDGSDMDALPVWTEGEAPGAKHGAATGGNLAPTKILPESISGEAGLTDLGRQILHEFKQLMKTDAALACVSDIYKVGLPAWVFEQSADAEQRASPSLSVRPYVKPTRSFDEQAQHLARLCKHDKSMALFFVPMAGLRIDGQHCLCIMPFMEKFVTLHDVLCSVMPDEWRLPAAGVVRNETELKFVLERVAQVLGEFLRKASCPPAEAISPDNLILDKIKRLRDSPTPILVGSRLFDKAQQRAVGIIADRAHALYGSRETRAPTWGHGDLNATNILVGIARGQDGGIRDVCVRLIDPNPSGAIGDAVFEIGRLAHWIEMGVPLSLAVPLRSAGESPFVVNYHRTPSSGDFLNEPPDLRLAPVINERLAPAYRHLMDCLEREVDGLRPLRDEKEPFLARQKLSLAVAVHNLVGTAWWPENLARTALFVAAVDELLFLQPDPRSAPLVGSCNGLWEVRRERMRRRGIRKSYLQ